MVKVILGTLTLSQRMVCLLAYPWVTLAIHIVFKKAVL